MTSQQVIEAREFLGLTIAQIIKILGVNRRTYTKWEDGSRKISAIGAAFIRHLVEEKKLQNQTDIVQ